MYSSYNINTEVELAVEKYGSADTQLSQSGQIKNTPGFFPPIHYIGEWYGC